MWSPRRCSLSVQIEAAYHPWVETNTPYADQRELPTGALPNTFYVSVGLWGVVADGT